MTIFFILVGVSVLGIGMVVFIMVKDKEDEDATVEKLPPEKLRSISYADLPPGSEPPEPKKSGLMGKIKIGKLKKYAEPTSSGFPVDENEGKNSLLVKLGLSKLLGKLSQKKDAFDHEDHEGSKSSPVKNLMSKLKLGKKKADDDDVPTATSFPSLKDKLKTFSKGKPGAPEKDADKPLPLLKDVRTGSASMSTTKRDESTTMPVLKANQPTPKRTELTSDDQKKIEVEVESATELAELKRKYETAEKLLEEKNSELDKLKTNFETEVNHRKDFNKIKDLLEKELKEVKDRVKQAKAELAESQSEKENLQKRIKQLEEKATKLEKEILAKEDEINNLKKPGAPATTAPVGGVALKSVPEAFKAPETAAPAATPAQEPPPAPKQAEEPMAPKAPVEPEAPEPPKTPEAPKAPEPEKKMIDYTPNDIEPPSQKDNKPPSDTPKSEIKKGGAASISDFEASLGISTGAAASPSAPKAPQPPEPPAITPANEPNEPDERGFLKLTPDPIADSEIKSAADQPNKQQDPPIQPGDQNSQKGTPS